MAADHGVAEARRLGISVGSDRPRNFASGGAAINVLAQCGARVVVVDVGIAAEFSQALPILHRKIAFGTACWRHHCVVMKTSVSARMFEAAIIIQIGAADDSCADGVGWVAAESS